MLESTTKFKVHDIVYKKEGFAIARGIWDGHQERLRLACRWYEDGEIGYPQTFGKPQWMMLPDDFEVTLHPGSYPEKDSVTITLR